jgi:hypothetical protein
MFTPFLPGLPQPSKALSGLALVLCVVLQFPAFLLWPFMSNDRREDVLKMVEALAGWGKSGNTDEKPIESRSLISRRRGTKNPNGPPVSE